MYSIRVNPDGALTMIHRDDYADLSSAVSITRASHVEPGALGGWYADLFPVGGPTLGPFKYRADALAAEFAWLDENRLNAEVSYYE